MADLKLCKIDDCCKPAHSKGFCSNHYRLDRKKSLPTCSVEGCSKQSDAKGMCAKHYAQHKKKNRVEKCSIDGCDEPLYARSLCNGHWNRWKDNGEDFDRSPIRKNQSNKGKTCSVDGCNRSARFLGLCMGHYHRQREYGDPLGGKNTIRGSGEAFLSDLMNSDIGDECVIWPFPLSYYGYGELTVNGEKIGAHRQSLIMHEGLKTPPPSDIETRHLCGNRACVNPHHLEFGSSKENGEDMVAHGRSLRGEKQPTSKLKRNEVLEIRRADGLYKDIASRFGISVPHVSGIKNNKRWAWLKG